MLGVVKSGCGNWGVSLVGDVLEPPERNDNEVSGLGSRARNKGTKIAPWRQPRRFFCGAPGRAHLLEGESPLQSR